MADRDTHARRRTTRIENVADAHDETLTLGQLAADAVARFGGSWTFILLFGFIIVSWMTANMVLLRREAFDPYPFILLNLVLSCVAALQAPVIMMSQRRQDERDRMEAENDYRVNVQAEAEIRELREALERMHREHGAALGALREEISSLRADVSS